MASLTSGAASATKEHYILYHNFWSSCSLMVRFSLAASRVAHPGVSFPYVEQEIDIQHGAQNDEFYVCRVNSKGQVPALTNTYKLPQPLTDSLDITFYLFGFYPNLSPSQFEHDISTLLRKLHKLSFFVLSFYDNPGRGAGIYAMTKKPLDDPSISKEHRLALERKLTRLDAREDFTTSLQPQTLKAEEHKTIDLLTEVGRIRDKHFRSGSPWLFGTEFATALDTHLMVLLARLLDVGRESLMPETIRSYTENIINMELWKGFMQGRTTMYSY